MANQLRTIMKMRQINGRRLAQMVDVTEAAICRYAQANRTPSLETAYRIAVALGVDVRDVFPPTLSQVARNDGQN
jgi:transcriptional regulator with XRE-family HTH domain